MWRATVGAGRASGALVGAVFALIDALGRYGRACRDDLWLARLTRGENTKDEGGGGNTLKHQTVSFWAGFVPRLLDFARANPPAGIV